MYKPDTTLPKGQSLVYPIDAHPDDFFPECIKFTAKKRIGANLDKIVKETQASLKRAVNTTKGKIKELKEKNIDVGDLGKLGVSGGASFLEMLYDFVGSPKISDDPGVVQGLENVEKIVEFVDKKMGEFTKAGTGNEYRNERMWIQKQQREAMGSIFMNMPNQIQFSEGANWGSQNNMFGGNEARRFVSGQGNAGGLSRLGGVFAGNMGNIAGAGIGALTGAVSKSLGVPMGSVGGMLAAEPLQRGAEAALSIAQNPYMEMMFQGIGFRSFRFDFVLRPRHRKEMERVGLIIKAFREFSRPSWNPQFGGQSFMNYPMEFDIQFLTLEEGDNKFNDNFTDNMHLPTIKPCVLSQVETNYTPQSIWAAHEAGAPVSITLGLSFTETELVTAEDIQAFDWPGPGGEYGRLDGGSNPNSSEPAGDSRANLNVYDIRGGG